MVGTHITGGVGRTDVVLQRLANASQLALVLLAVFGYFYTVLPVYQKSLLDEDIAKKTLELRAMETRLSQTETLLAGRETEFTNLTKRVADLRATADRAQVGLGRAQAEVGKLKNAVQSQYSELRPRLLRDFQSLARSQCAEKAAGESGFSECIERKVLTSPVLSALEVEDRDRLLKIVRGKSAAIDAAWSEYRASIAQKRQDAEKKAKEGQTRCEQLKLGDDYKDRMKKISIDYECNVAASNAQGDRLKIQVDEMFAGDKVLAPHLSAIVKEFFSSP